MGPTIIQNNCHNRQGALLLRPARSLLRSIQNGLCPCGRESTSRYLGVAFRSTPNHCEMREAKHIPGLYKCKYPKVPNGLCHRLMTQAASFVSSAGVSFSALEVSNQVCIIGPKDIRSNCHNRQSQAATFQTLKLIPPSLISLECSMTRLRRWHTTRWRTISHSNKPH
jgi:hypothetical protein